MKKWGFVLCAMVLATGCATPHVDPLPPVQHLECWKKGFSGWSDGVQFPVTVLVMTGPTESAPSGGFRAYGVDPDSQRILFMAEGSAREHLWDFSGDPLWGTVIQIDERMLLLAEKDARADEQTPLGRVQEAVHIVRHHYLPQVSRK